MGITNIGARQMMEPFTTGLTVHLFTNNFDPGDEPDEKDFDEPEGFGYQPIALYEQDRTISGAVATFDAIEFCFTGQAGNIWGFYTTNLRNEVNMWEKWTEPYEILREDDSFTLSIAVGR